MAGLNTPFINHQALAPTQQRAQPRLARDENHISAIVRLGSISPPRPDPLEGFDWQRRVPVDIRSRPRVRRWLGWERWGEFATFCLSEGGRVRRAGLPRCGAGMWDG
jgi:hypothetical protein